MPPRIPRSDTAAQAPDTPVMLDADLLDALMQATFALDELVDAFAQIDRYFERIAPAPAPPRKPSRKRSRRAR